MKQLNTRRWDVEDKLKKDGKLEIHVGNTDKNM